MKVVINVEFGGFSVSEEVFEELAIPWDKYGFLENETLAIDSEDDMAYRADPGLIAAIEKLGVKEASGSLACLKIVEVPDDVDWHIHDYDGYETVNENHRSWS